jgi:hypothetical protein
LDQPVTVSAFAISLMKGAKATFLATAFVVQTLLDISKVLGEQRDPDSHLYTERVLLPAYTLRATFDRYTVLGVTSLERAAADKGFAELSALTKAAELVVVGMKESHAAEVHPGSITSLVAEATAMIADVRAVSMEKVEKPLRDAVERAVEIMGSYSAWADGLGDSTDWDACFHEASKTILTKDPVFFRSVAQDTSQVLENCKRVFSALDLADPPCFKTAADVIASLRLTYAQGLFCTVFTPPVSEENAYKRKTNVHKVEKYCRDTPNIAWGNMPKAIQTRATQAKALE